MATKFDALSGKSWTRLFLFPFDCGRGFGGDIVHNSVDARDFVGDASGDFCQKLIGKPCPING